VTNKPKQIGTMGETAITRVFRDNGFPHAERRALAGVNDVGDILACPGLIIEVKWGEMARSASLADVDKWWAETNREVRNSRADIGLLIVQRRGYGKDRAHLSRCFHWRDYLTEAPLVNVITYLRTEGWGNPL